MTGPLKGRRPRGLGPVSSGRRCVCLMSCWFTSAGDGAVTVDTDVTDVSAGVVTAVSDVVSVCDIATDTVSGAAVGVPVVTAVAAVANVITVAAFCWCS